MIRRLIEDESGMTMGLVVIMVVLIGVMGAGLLTFVSTDLNTVIEVNQGQKALEAADAGVQAAKRQVISDALARDNYDGGLDDLPWSYCYNVTGCTGVSPTSTGSAGMRVNLDNGNYANVTILATYQSAETYRVISEGRAGEARRKIEAVIRQDPAVSIPPVYFSRSDITVGGSTDPSGLSFFTLRNFTLSGGTGLGTANDQNYGKWAATTGGGPYPNTTTGSYPNTFNATARGNALAGVGAMGTITGDDAKLLRGTRSYDITTNPKMVSNFGADGVPGQQSTEIGFPFEVPTPADDKKEINVLRQRALALEQANPGNSYYIDSNPGNGVDDPGLSNGNQTISTWPSGSTDQTVVFYKYAAYDSNNDVGYTAGAPSCGTTTNKGAIVIENGDMAWSGNRRFDGAIIIRAYDPVDPEKLLTGNVGGLYSAAGTACLYGYVNTSGGMNITGTMNPGTAPDLSGLSSYRGSMEVLSWRELYE